VIGQAVALEESRAGLVVSRQVHGGRLSTVVLIAGKVNAPVETIVDSRSIALFGIAMGITFGLVTAIFKLLRPRR
jgi:hypothetical protein